MHTQVPRKVRHSGHRLAIAGAGLLGAAGLAVFAVGGASGAMASTPGTVTGGLVDGTMITAAVTVPSVTTLALSNASLNFATPTTLPQSETAAITGTASSNDTAGYTVQVVSNGTRSPATTAQRSAGASNYDFLGHGADYFPITNLSVQGTTGGTFGEADAPVTTDTSAAAASNAINDNYTLNVPATAAADADYTAWFNYAIAGN